MVWMEDFDGRDGPDNLEDESTAIIYRNSVRVSSQPLVKSSEWLAGPLAIARHAEWRSEQRSAPLRRLVRAA